VHCHRNLPEEIKCTVTVISYKCTVTVISRNLQNILRYWFQKRLSRRGQRRDDVWLMDENKPRCARLQPTLGSKRDVGWSRRDLSAKPIAFLSGAHAGAVAVAGTGDITTGEFEDSVHSGSARPGRSART